MEKLQTVAFISVGRAVAFGGLGIFTIMIALSFEPVLALRSGGALLLLQLAVLLLKAKLLPYTNYRKTEAWLLLKKDDRPDERYAGLVMRNALRDAYLWFARGTAGVAVALLAGAILVGWLGVGPADEAPTFSEVL
jgi:hypothetical protein